MIQAASGRLLLNRRCPVSGFAPRATPSVARAPCKPLFSKSAVTAGALRPEVELASSSDAQQLISEPERTEQPWFSRIVSGFSKIAVVVGLMVAVALSNAGNAFAANTAGRTGGSNFSARRAQVASSRSSSVVQSTTHHTTTIIHTGPSFGWGMPSFFFPVVPMGYGYHSSGTSTLLTILVLAVVAFAAVQAFNMFRNRDSHHDDVDEEYEYSPPVTVAKVQVGLLAIAKDLKSSLNALAARADTSSPEGLHLILQETAIALMRNPAYCVYASSSCKVLEHHDQAERMFNSMSLEERGKVKEETLVNYGGVSKPQAAATTRSEGVSELIVVNLMVAAEGELKLPAIKTQADLKAALSMLGSVSPSDIMAVELLWTPQADGDTLSQQDVMLTYPALVPL